MGLGWECVGNVCGLPGFRVKLVNPKLEVVNLELSCYGNPSGIGWDFVLLSGWVCRLR